MKTERALNLEKYSLEDEDIPNNLFMMDNTIALYSNMVPPGQHYFYLCQEKDAIFLSPKYEVVRFKKTNVFLNRITVMPRLEDNLDTVFVAKDAIDVEDVFMKDRSVFKDFREDTDEYLQKCFDQDM